VDRTGLRVRPLIFALLCLAALSFAAATLDTTTDPDADLGFGGSGPSEGPSSQATPDPDVDDPGSDDDGRAAPIELDSERGFFLDPCVTWLSQPLVQLGLLAAVAGIFLIATYIEDWLVGLAALIVVGYPGTILYLLLTACPDADGFLFDLSRPGQPTEGGGGVFGGASTTATPSLPAIALLVLVGLSLLAVGVLVLTGDQERTAVESGDDEDAVDPVEGRVERAQLGRAAGRAADRIERSGEFENEVYRAWAEMTDPLDVDHPEASTPAEFAAAAAEAGIDPDDVERLTDLFERVRYGGTEPTEAVESEAVETLRRIEATYAGEES
jgi:hypothetical protein